jgi:hypothetical protein
LLCSTGIALCPMLGYNSWGEKKDPRKPQPVCERPDSANLLERRPRVVGMVTLLNADSSSTGQSGSVSKTDVRSSSSRWRTAVAVSAARAAADGDRSSRCCMDLAYPAWVPSSAAHCAGGAR